MVRTFVALLIPPGWAAHLGALSTGLAAGTRGLSWVKQENLHITLRFLGDLDEAAVDRASAAVSRSLALAIAPRARLGRLSAFPNLRRPRVLWVGLSEGEEAVSELAVAADEGLRGAGFGPSDRPFRAHITLARVREGARGLETLRDAAGPEPPPAAFLDRVAVMKSDLHPSGSRYTALQEVRLRPPDR
jgi:2'-5' RNA ligase